MGWFNHQLEMFWRYSLVRYILPYKLVRCIFCLWNTLQGTITYPIRVGTFESMIFRLYRGGICDRSQEGIHYCTFSFVVVILDILLFSHVPGSPDFPQPACGTSNCVGLPPKRDHLLEEWDPPQLKWGIWQQLTVTECENMTGKISLIHQASSKELSTMKRAAFLNGTKRVLNIVWG